jgi:hypothetical protein
MARESLLRSNLTLPGLEISAFCEGALLPDIFLTSVACQKSAYQRLA